MKRAILGLVVILLAVAGCGSAETASIPGATSTPSAAPTIGMLTDQEMAALSEIGRVALKTDDAVQRMRGSIFADSQQAGLRQYQRAKSLLLGLDPHATDDAEALDSGRLNEMVVTYKAFRSAARAYAQAVGEMYQGDDSAPVMEAQKEVDAARHAYLASVKSLNPYMQLP